MTPAMSLNKEMTGLTGRYVARINGIEGEAEITFAVLGALIIRAEHTDAPETMRGTGAAQALVEYMVADARTLGFKIMPICPYVHAQFNKHPDWRGLMITET